MGFYLKTTITRLLYIFIFGLLLVGCDDEVKRVDTSNIELNVKIERFDQSLLAIAEGGISPKEYTQLEKDYPSFLPIFTSGVIRVAGNQDSITAIGLSNFVLDSNIHQLGDTVQAVFSSLSSAESLLNNAFKNYKYYFSDKLIPRIVTFYSGFNYAQIADDSLLAIGLDMYLGSNSSYYPMLGFPKYRFVNMSADQIPVDAIYSWITTEYELPSNGNLLSQIIYFGKIHLAVNYLLPDENLQRSFGYSEEQFAWCEKNEAEIWSFLIDQELLYTIDNIKIRKFVGEGPFTAGFSEEAPAKLGQYIGWKIVKAYTERHPEVELEQLLEQTDAQQILNESFYKPSR